MNYYYRLSEDRNIRIIIIIKITWLSFLTHATVLGYHIFVSWFYTNYHCYSCLLSQLHKGKTNQVVNFSATRQSHLKVGSTVHRHSDNTSSPVGPYTYLLYWLLSIFRDHIKKAVLFFFIWLHRQPMQMASSGRNI